MPLRINHNIAAINSHRNLIKNTEVQNKNLERLSSGLKINRGADSPAGLIISERMRAQIAGLKQAIDNSETGITMLQTAESALEEVNRTLINVRQLAISSANEAVNDQSMLDANQQELENSLQTIDRIARISNYGKRAILDGRTTPDITDIQAMIHPVLRHRIIPNFNAEADGVSRDQILNKLIDDNK